MGMGSALETFCGGSNQYHMLGIHMQKAMFVNLLVSVPLSCICANAGHIHLYCLNVILDFYKLKAMSSRWCSKQTLEIELLLWLKSGLMEWN